MHLSNTLLGLVAVAAATVQAQASTPIQVTVGADSKLQFNPSNIVAPVGTQVEFSFYPKVCDLTWSCQAGLTWIQNHSVIQSSFANPCHPLDGGFFSGFVPTKNSPSGTTFTITVQNASPIWIYCGQTTGNHCQSGMVAAINALVPDLDIPVTVAFMVSDIL